MDSSLAADSPDDAEDADNALPFPNMEPDLPTTTIPFENSAAYLAAFAGLDLPFYLSWTSATLATRS